jgi:phosphoribosylformimino-5-aminoimidazole carboxamide ribonucleotide (ProFAR) isomerase
MDLYARVNILDGRAVRLPHGMVSEAIPLDADPVARARGWVAKGASQLFIVDLDAAAHGDYRNRGLIADIIEAADVPVIVGGGVRSTSGLERLLAAGASKVTMGTVAIIDQVLLWDLCRENPGRILVSLDVRPDEELAIRGWTANSGRYLEEVLIELSSAGAAGFMIAEVGRDALTEPPNLAALRLALTLVDEPVIAAGGVRDLSDIRELVRLEEDGKHIAGVVVGREVTAGRFTVEQAASFLSGVGRGAGQWDDATLRAALAAFQSSHGEEGKAAEFVDWLTGAEE